MNIGQILAIVNDNKSNIKLFGIAFMITLFFSGYIQNVLINTCIFGYLSFNTIRFIKNAKMPESSLIPMTQLLKQWTCFSLLIVAEYLFSSIFSFFFMSIFYNSFKVVSLILLLQNNQNLLLVYDIGILPLFNSYEHYMELAFNTLENEANKFKSLPEQNKEINYNIYEHIKPYVEKVRSFVSTVKVVDDTIFENESVSKLE